MLLTDMSCIALNVVYLFRCWNRSRSRISYIEWFDCYNGKTRGRERKREKEREIEKEGGKGMESKGKRRK